MRPAAMRIVLNMLYLAGGSNLCAAFTFRDVAVHLSCALVGCILWWVWSWLCYRWLAMVWELKIQVPPAFILMLAFTPLSGRVLGNVAGNGLILFFHLTTLVVLVPPIIGDYKGNKQRDEAPRDPERKSCGYNLTGNVSGQWPECGEPIRPKKRGRS
jgi:hypothetical protein